MIDEEDEQPVHSVAGLLECIILKILILAYNRTAF